MERTWTRILRPLGWLVKPHYPVHIQVQLLPQGEQEAALPVVFLKVSSSAQMLEFRCFIVENWSRS